MKTLEWAILDRGREGRLYIARTWKTELEVDVELLELLKYFPKNSEWRRRLYIGRWKSLPPGRAPKFSRKKKGEEECARCISTTSPDSDQPVLSRKVM